MDNWIILYIDFKDLFTVNTVLLPCPVTQRVTEYFSIIFCDKMKKKLGWIARIGQITREGQTVGWTTRVGQLAVDHVVWAVEMSEFRQLAYSSCPACIWPTLVVQPTLAIQPTFCSFCHSKGSHNWLKVMK